jgi:hypothetical protein
MDNFSNPGTPAPSPAPMEAPMPAPMPAPAPATPPPPQFGNGGSPGGKFFDGVTLVDVGMIALTTTAIIITIYYYHQKIKQVQRDKSVTQTKVEELEANVVNLMAPNYKKM